MLPHAQVVHMMTLGKKLFGAVKSMKSGKREC
jgi:hypothetical protein